MTLPPRQALALTLARQFLAMNGHWPGGRTLAKMFDPPIRYQSADALIRKLRQQGYFGGSPKADADAAENAKLKGLLREAFSAMCSTQLTFAQHEATRPLRERIAEALA